jgi:hypothetical protein
MSDLFFALLFGAAGTAFLVWRDRLVAANFWKRIDASPSCDEFRSSVAGRTLLNASIGGSR